MLKNKNLWLKVAAVALFSFQSSALTAGQDSARSSAAIPALAELTASVPANLVELPAAPEVREPACAEKLSDKLSAAPLPGKSFLPVVRDQQRIDAIMKLLRDINGGVHLPYSQDGATFSNKEGRLPKQPQGFYKEYTLLTGNAPHTVTIGDKTYQVAPDLSARGSERVIIGGGQRIYYTPDHYANFIELTVQN